MRTKLIFLVICVVFVSSLSIEGCASTQKNKTLNTFDERSRLYGRLLRWREYEGAVNMIRHQDESEVEVNLDDYKDIRVTDYEIKRVAMGEDLKTAIVEAEVSYYFETTNAVKTLRDTQSWWYVEEAETWFLDGDLPAF